MQKHDNDGGSQREFNYDVYLGFVPGVDLVLKTLICYHWNHLCDFSEQVV